MPKLPGWSLSAPARAALPVALLTAALYFVASRVMVVLNDPVNLGAGFWPGAGITLAALVLTRSSAWPVILVAVGLAEVGNDLTLGYSLASSLWWAAGNVVEPLVAATLLRRAGLDTRGDVHTTVQFVAIAVLFAPTVGGAVGIIGTLASGATQPYLLLVLKWAVGDGLGVLTVTPAVVVWVRSRDERRALLSPEGIAGLLSVVLVSTLVFRNWQFAWDTTLPFLVLPPLLWMAVRFRLTGATVATLLMAQIANAATGLGYGPFAMAGADPRQAILLLQVFIGVVAGTTILMGARTSESVRHRQYADDQRARADREQVLTRLGRAALEATSRDELAEATATIMAEALDGADEDRGLLEGARTLHASACRRLDAEEALAQGNVELQAALDAREHLLSVVSHELRTPLTPIIGFAEYLAQHGGELDPVARRAVETIERNGRRLSAMVEDLVALARTHRGVTTEPTDVDLAVLVPRALDDLDRGDVDLQVPATPCPAWADPRHVEQVLANLVNNATRHGRPPITVEVSSSRDRALVSVTDRGEGVPPEFMPHLFEEFTQLGGPTASEGLGLGLAIARALARANGGELTLEVPPGGGARFVLALPARAPEGTERLVVPDLASESR